MKGGQLIENLSCSSLEGGKLACEIASNMPMSTSHEEDNDNMQSPSDSIGNETSVNANNKKVKLWLYLIKQVTKFNDHYLKKANLGDNFPVETWKEGGPTHAKDCVRIIIKKEEEKGESDALWSTYD